MLYNILYGYYICVFDSTDSLFRKTARGRSLGNGQNRSQALKTRQPSGPNSKNKYI